LSDVLRDAVDERFEFVRYGESLARPERKESFLCS